MMVATIMPPAGSFQPRVSSGSEGELMPRLHHTKDNLVTLNRGSGFNSRISDLDRQINLLKNCECIKESEVRDLCNLARDILLEESNI